MASDKELRIFVKHHRRSLTASESTLTRTKSGGSNNASSMVPTADAQSLKHQSIIDINPDEGSFFHAMISYRVSTDATFVSNMHNAMNLIASQREDLRSLDDFPWPKEFKRAETTGSSGVRIFLDKECLLDGAQWEGNLKGSGGFVGALLKSLVFVPVFSICPGFTGSLGQMARIWNPLWDASLSSAGDEGLKVESKPTTHAHFIEGDVIATLDDHPVNKASDVWKFMACSLEPTVRLEIVRTFTSEAIQQLCSLPNLDSLRADSLAGHAIGGAYNPISISSLKGAIALTQQERSCMMALGFLENDALLEATFGSACSTALTMRSFLTDICRFSRVRGSQCSIRFKRAIIREDCQDNVLLELILAHELHLKHHSHSIGNSLQPCSYLYPIFKSNDVFSVVLSKKASAVTNQKAREILQANQIEPSPRLKSNDLSPHDVVDFFKKFQGVQTWQHGEEENQIQQCTQKVLSVIKYSAKRVESSFVKAYESNNSQSYELRSWLQLHNLSYYARVLAHNDISSMHAFSQLDNSAHIITVLASQGAKASGRTQVSEYNELSSAVELAKKSELSLSLQDRYSSFVDHDASFMTAAFSSRACEIMFTKPATQLICFVLASIGFIVTIVAYIPDLNNRINLLAGAAAFFVNLSIMVLSLSFYFFSIKYTRRMLYVIKRFHHCLFVTV
jgi:energy-converting hydrogenase Eha subunit C